MGYDSLGTSCFEGTPLLVPCEILLVISSPTAGSLGTASEAGIACAALNANHLMAGFERTNISDSGGGESSADG